MKDSKQEKDWMYRCCLKDGGCQVGKNAGPPWRESELWLRANEEMRIFVLKLQKTDSANNHNELGNGLSPRASR